MGDALDHWKGSLFEFLQGTELLWNFAVDPMLTDRPSWREADFELLTRLLRIDRSRILPHNAALSQRPQYFAEITHHGDLDQRHLRLHHWNAGNQLEFVNLIIDHLTEQGVMQPARLDEAPFTDLTPRGPEYLFEPVELDALLGALEAVSATAMAAA